jgi:ribosomal protein S18 acetylase RimI-like enzyme
MAMSIAGSISRFSDFYSRHGFRETMRRTGLAIRRELFSSRMVLFSCDLSIQTTPELVLTQRLRVEEKRSESELSPEDAQQMITFWNPRQAQRNIQERFRLGASLWLIKSEDKLAGYGWSLRGATVEPHYFPITQSDAHLFDFHVFTQYRGRGLNPYLVGQILHNLAAAGVHRAHIEAAEWNQAQLSSLAKTPFRRIGLARKSTILGRTFVRWKDRKVNSSAQSTIDSGQIDR